MWKTFHIQTGVRLFVRVFGRFLPEFAQDNARLFVKHYPCKRENDSTAEKPPTVFQGEFFIMAKSNNRINVPEAREGMNRFKMEAANEVGVNLKNGYNGDLTSRQAGSVGGQMVKKMVEQYENSLK